MACCVHERFRHRIRLCIGDNGPMRWVGRKLTGAADIGGDKGGSARSALKQGGGEAFRPRGQAEYVRLLQKRGNIGACETADAIESFFAPIAQCVFERSRPGCDNGNRAAVYPRREASLREAFDAFFFDQPAYECDEQVTFVQA